MPTKPDPRFLAVTAHDLRGAVGVIEGALKELTRDLSTKDAEAEKLSQMMARSSQRLLLLGDRLSALGKLMDGSDLEFQDNVELSGLVKEAANRAFAAHARRSLRLRVEGSPVSLSLHLQTFSAAVSEVTALFCGFSQSELLISLSREVDAIRIKFESDNTAGGIQRALRDRQGVTQANLGIDFVETVLSRHRGAIEISESDGSNAAVTLVIARSF